eukprot:c39908_g1_i1 orf=64-561(+)
MQNIVLAWQPVQPTISSHFSRHTSCSGSPMEDLSFILHSFTISNRRNRCISSKSASTILACSIRKVVIVFWEPDLAFDAETEGIARHLASFVSTENGGPIFLLFFGNLLQAFCGSAFGQQVVFLRFHSRELAGGNCEASILDEPKQTVMPKFAGINFTYKNGVNE